MSWSRTGVLNTVSGRVGLRRWSRREKESLPLYNQLTSMGASRPTTIFKIERIYAKEGVVYPLSCRTSARSNSLKY